MKLKISDICEQIRGVSYSPKDVLDSTKGIPILRANNISDDIINYDNLVYVNKERISQKQILKKGDILICASSGSKHLVGKAGLITNDNIISSFGAFCKVLRSRSVSSEYLFHYFCSDSYRNKISAMSEGANINNLKNAHFETLEINVYSVEKEIVILKKLNLVKSLISKRKQQLAKLDELAKSRFLEMFGDPNTNPFSYKVCRLNEITETKLSYGSGASSKNFDGELRYIRITDILESGDLSDDKKSPTNFDEKYLLNDGDILFARSGATVGKTYCYKSKDGKSIYAGYLIRLVPNKKIVYPEYIYAFTKTKYYESLIQSIQRAVAQPNINAKEYGEFKIILPPLEKQAEYILFLQQLDKSKFRIKKSLEKLELTYKALLQEYFG